MNEPESRYVLVMLPYPSGSGLHLGHAYNYAVVDTYCRWLRYTGVDVFQPFGYDAFGLPAENYAKKVGRNAAQVTWESIDNFRDQMFSMKPPMMNDWSPVKEAITNGPSGSS